MRPQNASLEAASHEAGSLDAGSLEVPVEGGEAGEAEGGEEGLLLQLAAPVPRRGQPAWRRGRHERIVSIGRIIITSSKRRRPSETKQFAT